MSLVSKLLRFCIALTGVLRGWQSAIVCDHEGAPRPAPAGVCHLAWIGAALHPLPAQAVAQRTRAQSWGSRARCWCLSHWLGGKLPLNIAHPVGNNISLFTSLFPHMPSSAPSKVPLFLHKFYHFQIALTRCSNGDNLRSFQPLIVLLAAVNLRYMVLHFYSRSNLSTYKYALQEEKHKHECWVAKRSIEVQVLERTYMSVLLSLELASRKIRENICFFKSCTISRYCYQLGLGKVCWNMHSLQEAGDCIAGPWFKPKTKTPLRVNVPAYAVSDAVVDSCAVLW